MKEMAFGMIPVFKTKDRYSFLLIQHNAGHWAFPKGHSEKGESELETAKREFEEETGIKNYNIIDNVSFTESYIYNKKQKPVNKTVKYFLCIVNDPSVKIQQGEIRSYKWAGFNKAFDTITFNECKKIIKEVNKYLETDGHL